MTDEQKLLNVLGREKQVQEMVKELRSQRVILVRKLHESGMSLRKLAKLTDVSHVRISQWINSADTYQPE